MDYAYQTIARRHVGLRPLDLEVELADDGPCLRLGDGDGPMLYRPQL